MIPKKPDKQQHYQYLVEIMKEGNVDSKEKAEHHIKGMKSKAMRFSLIILVIATVIYLAFPAFVFFIALISVFTVAWAWSSTYATQKMIRQYISKELKE
ncbi:MAG: hypothetical protein ACRBCI_00255 [Cellvibrionaceae bacterium]